jgi:D-galactose 1-dehydrogenase
MKRIRLALVGFGKIARDQHLPALTASQDFELVAVAGPGAALNGVAGFQDVQALLASGLEISALAVCTPPQARFAVARLGLERGLHMLLEKPPAMTVGELDTLVGFARRRSLALFAAWHSRHAQGVEPARAWLDGRRIDSVDVTWKEDVHVWHPGQHWIWQPGGLGVFDPGINALSILTRLFPQSLVVEDAELAFPANCATPIAARVLLRGAAGFPVRAELDFRQTGVQTWDIHVATDGGPLLLSDGGARVHVDARAVETPVKAEYPDLYAHFAQLISDRRIDVDASPLRLVADTFLRARRVAVEPFVDA